VAKKEYSKWPNCPDKQREKVPGINIVLDDMVNPCELAKKWGVQLRRLRAFQMLNSTARPAQMVNDFALGRGHTAPLISVRKGSKGRKRKR
jgi:hypothetical protein